MKYFMLKLNYIRLLRRVSMPRFGGLFDRPEGFVFAITNAVVALSNYLDGLPTRRKKQRS